MAAAIRTRFSRAPCRRRPRTERHTTLSRSLPSSTFQSAEGGCCGSSLGIPMKVIALNARLLRDEAGNNMYYTTNSVTLGGGESLDVILDATGFTAPQKFFLYTPNLDHLSNDAENFGGLMTEVNVCNSVDPSTKKCS